MCICSFLHMESIVDIYIFIPFWNTQGTRFLFVLVRVLQRSSPNRKYIDIWRFMGFPWWLSW